MNLSSFLLEIDLETLDMYPKSYLDVVFENDTHLIDIIARHF